MSQRTMRTHAPTLESWVWHPAVLASFALIGGIIGASWGDAVRPLFEASRAVANLLALVALPWALASATLGMRNLLSLPRPVWRTLVLAGGSLLVTAITALAATAIEALLLDGPRLDQEGQHLLGRLMMAMEHVEEHELHTMNEGVAGAASHHTDSLFQMAVSGQMHLLLAAGLMVGVVLMSLQGPSVRTILLQTEAVHRACEWLMRKMALLLPVAVVGTAASMGGAASLESLRALSGFLLPFLAVSLALAAVMVGVIWWVGSVRLGQVIASLSQPAWVSLFSGSALAAIPFYTQALVEGLGVRRALAEVLVPAGPFIFRAGEAVFIVGLCSFLAHAFDLHFSLAQWATVAAVATWAAVHASPLSTTATFAIMSGALSTLDLPLDGLTPVLLTVEVLTLGVRNLLSALALCVVLVFVSRDLEREAAGESQAPAEPPAALVVARPVHLALAGTLLLMALGLTLLAGIGWGIRTLG